jgi:AAA family ATP:ADP antiporter
MLGKSGGSFIQQGLIFTFGSLAVSTPYLAAVLAVIMLVWIRSARNLNIQFKSAMAEQGLEE